MRVLPWAASAAALFALTQSAVPRAAGAQTWSPSVNQRMDSPTSQSDSYVGVSLGQLIVALGLTLQGVPPQGLDDIQLMPRRQTAAVPAPADHHRRGVADSPTVPVVPAADKQPDPK